MCVTKSMIDLFDQKINDTAQGSSIAQENISDKSNFDRTFYTIDNSFLQSIYYVNLLLTI